LSSAAFEFFLNKRFESGINMEAHHLKLVACFQTNARHGYAYNGALLNR
jgi:hypothetical protein